MAGEEIQSASLGNIHDSFLPKPALMSSPIVSVSYLGVSGPALRDRGATRVYMLEVLVNTIPPIPVLCTPCVCTSPGVRRTRSQTPLGAQVTRAEEASNGTWSWHASVCINQRKPKQVQEREAEVTIVEIAGVPLTMDELLHASQQITLV